MEGDVVLARIDKGREQRRPPLVVLLGAYALEPDAPHTSIYCMSDIIISLREVGPPVTLASNQGYQNRVSFNFSRMHRFLVLLVLALAQCLNALSWSEREPSPSRPRFHFLLLAGYLTESAMNLVKAVPRVQVQVR